MLATVTTHNFLYMYVALKLIMQRDNCYLNKLFKHLFNLLMILRQNRMIFIRIFLYKNFFKNKKTINSGLKSIRSLQARSPHP